MHWYGGSIAEAVTLSKQKNAIFVVFVEGSWTILYNCKTAKILFVIKFYLFTVIHLKPSYQKYFISLLCMTN